MELNITTGIEGRKEIAVTMEMTAVAYGSGTVEVFATPAMIALMEQTAMDSVAPLLPEEFVTVGTEVSVKHFKATLPGKVVTCFSKLIRSEGKKLVFEVIANDESGVIGTGTHTRYIVDKQMFIGNLKDK
ncbi:MAG: thioesterase family protein [Lentimicrobiaceae bacterium]|jgi:predicted thioesterase